MSIYYFSASGSTSNTGTSTGSPWPLSKVSTVGVAGDFLLFNKGDTFTGTINYTRSGSSSNPITFDLYGTSPHNAIIDGGGSTSAPVLKISGSYITINNLVIQNNSYSQGIINLTTGVHNIIINNCYINKGIRGINAVQCGTGGVLNIHIHNSWFTKIADNNTHTNGGGSHIQINNCNGSGLEIDHNNHFEDMTTSTLGVGDIISLYQSNGTSSSYMLVHDNNVRGGSNNTNGYAGAIGGDVGGSYQHIYNNTFIDTGVAGFQIQGGTFIIGENNKIYGPGHPYVFAGIEFANWSGKPCNNITIQNNIINWTSSGGTTTNNTHMQNSNGDSGTGGTLSTPTGWSTNTVNGVHGAVTNTSLPSPTLWTGTPWDTSTGGSLVFNPIPSKVYGTANFSPGATSSNSITYTSSNTSVATIVSNNIHIVGAGSSTITANDGVTSLSQPLTVTKANLSITADDKTKNQGTSNPTLTVSYSGFVYSENNTNLLSQPTITTSASIGSPAGSYSIVPSGATSNNYNISFINGTLTITGVSLVFPSIPSKVYGTSDFNPGATSSNSITYTSSNTSVATIVSNQIHIIGVGTSTITANDGISSLPQTLTVTKATLNVVADSHLITAGSSIPSLTLSYSGFVYSETISNLTTSPTATTTATSGSPVGTYSIVPSGGVSSNYSFNYTNGILTIINTGTIIFHLPVVLL